MKKNYVHNIYNSIYKNTKWYEYQLVVIKDYESAFDSVTFIQIPWMIPLADFQPLSVAKTNIFSSTTEVLQKDISVTM